MAHERRVSHLDGQPRAGDEQPFGNPAGQLVQQNLGVAVDASYGHHDLHARADGVQVAMLWQGQR